MSEDDISGSSQANKKVIYLDQFTLSHMASSQDPRFASSPSLVAYKELYALARDAVHKNLAVFPRSQTHIEEIDLAEHSAAALTEVSHTLSWGIQFLLPHDMRVRQLLRHAHAFLDDKPLSPPPWDEAFEDDPQASASAQSTIFLGGPILIASTHTVPPEARLEQAKRRERIASGFEAQRVRQVKAGVTFKAAMAFEGWGRIAHSYLFSGFSMDYLREAESRLTHGLPVEPALYRTVMSASSSHAQGLHDAAISEKISGVDLFSFLTSFAALRVPFVDIESRLTAMLMTDKVRKVEPSDIDDIAATSNAAPYCDVVICDVRIADLLRRNNGQQRSILDDYPFRVFTGAASGVEGLRAYLRELIETSTAAA